MAEQKHVRGRRRRWPWVVAVLACAVLAVVLPRVERASRERRWVDAACAAAEEYLRAAPAPDVPGGAGAFQGLSGDGYSHPVWNINAPHLIVHREARFANAALPLSVYVWEPAPGASDPGRWEVEDVEQYPPPNPAMRVYVRLR